MARASGAPKDLTCPPSIGGCRKQLKTPTGWAAHVRVCTGWGALACDSDDPECQGKRFAFRTDLNRHKESKHGDGSRRFACPHPSCKKVFLRQSFLNQHLKRHEGQRQKAHLCSECVRLGVSAPEYSLRRFRPKRLCGAHAESLLGAKRVVTASVAACRCFDLLEQLGVFGQDVRLQHVHFDEYSATCAGKEPDGLVWGQKWRPDAWDPVNRIWVDFLGNEYHGWPPGADPPPTRERNYYGEKYTDLYLQTMARLRDVRDFGPKNVQVYYVWEHEWRRAKTLEDVIRSVHLVKSQTN